jgi:hypothetical protein
MAGGCRCGRVRVDVAAAPLLTMACHCTGCQRMSASAFSLSVAVPADGFRVMRGETALGGLGASPQHRFCPHCMTWMFTRVPEMAFFVNLRATMLDDASWFTPFVETYRDEALPWARTPARHSYARLPEPTDYDRLAAEFAETAAA